MRAILLDQPGTLDTLRVDEVSEPQPGTGEIRVRVAAIGLNPVDYKLAGRGNPAWSYPHILGLDVAGTIDTVGADVDSWRTGDRVFYHGNLARPGGYAELAITTAHTTAAIPDGVDFVSAAAIPCAGLTAYQGLVRRLNVQAGHTYGCRGAPVASAALASRSVDTWALPSSPPRPPAIMTMYGDWVPTT